MASMHRSWAVVGWLAPVALLLLLVTSNVRFAVGSLPVYEALFDRHGVAARTGITPDGLRGVGRQIQEYFASDAEPLRVRAAVEGVERDLFGADEVSHMADVKALFLLTFRLQGASALFLLLVTGLAVYAFRGAVWATLAAWLRRGPLVTAGIMAVFGIASLVAFDPLFTLFHNIAFPQGNFLFPQTADLVRVFPFGFWRDMTLLIGAMTIVEAAALYAVGLLLRRVAARA
ncbi:MAG: DUF1461 domain-containing protein [Chloroflexi bacterium]|nr:DUF1461 domain-containing protein [Chloroflexota bacterium]